jgi:decaprenyl-phosphate phosphoribosyltransferase
MRFSQDLLQALRPKQWVKNLLILAAPASSGRLFDYKLQLLETFILFCAVSSIGYLFNDWNDRNLDALHPKKKNRPFASKRMGAWSGINLASLLVVISTIVVLRNPQLFEVALVYLATTLVYTKRFKAIAVLEMVTISFCFVLRAVAGGVSIGVPLSEWFLVVVSFGALLVVSGKRLAESMRIEETRRVLAQYSQTFIQGMLIISSTGTLLGYALWAFSIERNPTIAKISFVPLSLCILRVYWILDQGKSDTNEEIIGRDKILIFALISLLSSSFYVFYF